MLGASRTSLANARKRLAQLSAADGVDADTLSVELLAVARLLVRELPLRRTLADASAATQAKTALLDRLLRDSLSAPTLEFVKELAAARWSRPGDLADATESLGVLASFEVAVAAGTLDEVEDQLFRLARLIERDKPLREALESAWHADDRKRELLAGLLTGKVDPITLRVAQAAAASSIRHRTVAEALEHFSLLAAELRDRLNARVTLASEPTAEQLERLAAELSRVFGRQMGLRIELDPSILGGAVVRVGDQVLDASIARNLDRARRGLAPAS